MANEGKAARSRFPLVRQRLSKYFSDASNDISENFKMQLAQNEQRRDDERAERFKRRRILVEERIATREEGRSRLERDKRDLSNIQKEEHARAKIEDL